MKKFTSKKFLIMLGISLAVSLLLANLMSGTIGNISAGLLNSCFESINSDFTQNKNVRATLEDGNKVRVEAVFTNLQSAGGKARMRFVEVNYFNEIALPLSIYLALFSSLLFIDKKRYKMHLAGLAVFLLYLYFKIFAIVFDNYNFPGMAIKDLFFPVKQMVYGWNFFLNQTGSSSNLVIVLIIWLAFGISRADFENKKGG